jgi:hypothetical protein
MEMEILNLNLALGPLHYHLQAHDKWAAGLLARMAGQIDCRNFGGTAHRLVHVVKQSFPSTFSEGFKAGDLAPELAALVPEKLPARGWQITGNDTLHLTWRHAESEHAFWTESGRRKVPTLPFNLPLDLLFLDILELGGGIVHGGLAIYQGQGVLLTAPPGGGKTTAFSTIPENWQLMSDDAVLVWPDAQGIFLSSPLPTWSVLLGINPQLAGIRKWQVGVGTALQMTLFLEKADTIGLIPRRQVDAVFPLYRAFSEYPIVNLMRSGYRIKLFKAAAALTRAVPSWSLQMPRHADLWPHLEKELMHGHG